MISQWMAAGLPRARAAVLQCLHMREPGLAPHALSDSDWEEALAFADPAGLTLFMAQQMHGALPERIRARTWLDLLRNRQRLRRLRELYAAVGACLEGASIPFLLLKGWPHCEHTGLDPERRVQYDVDVVTPPRDGRRAADALRALGFEPFAAVERFPTDHLPPLIRKTGWEFRGDYFDPEIPTSIEVHVRFWDEGFLRVPAPGTGAFWERREIRNRGGLELPVLAPADALGYASLHVVKHLLCGSVRPFHVYELAAALERQSGNEALWRDWLAWHDPQLRRLEVVGYRLAHAWFGCTLPHAAEEDWLRLPESVRAWFREFVLSPAQPSNKNELWLHCALLPSRREWPAVIRRRLLPTRLPAPVDGVYLPDGKLTWVRRALRFARQLRFIAARAAHHAAAALRLAGAGVRWWRSVRPSSL